MSYAPKGEEMKHFHDGQKITELMFPDGDNIASAEDLTITVQMENGQMGMVPWAVVKSSTGTWKWNLALVLGVELEKK